MAFNASSSTTAPRGFDGELTTMSFVFFVTFSASGSSFHDGGSSAYVLTVAPANRTSVGYERKPGSGTRTSSPSPTKAWKIAYSPSSVPAVMQTSDLDRKSVV